MAVSPTGQIIDAQGNSTGKTADFGSSTKLNTTGYFRAVGDPRPNVYYRDASGATKVYSTAPSGVDLGSLPMVNLGDIQGFTGATPADSPAPQASATPAATTPATPSQPAAPNATTPNNAAPAAYAGSSVVDALSILGLPSDISSRSALAKQEGIAYDPKATGSASATQNKNLLADIKSKWTDFYAQGKGKTAPQTSSDAMTAKNNFTSSYTSPSGASAGSDPVTSSVNEATSNFLKDQNNLTSYESTAVSVERYQNEVASELGIPALKAEDLNLKTIMAGTEDDIRNEVSAAGGMITESQLESMAGTRNKVILKQATQVENTLSLAEDTLTSKVSAYQGDQQIAIQALRDKVTSSQNYMDLVSKIQTSTYSSYDKQVAAMGWTNFTNSLTPNGKRILEGQYGWAKGSLDDPKFVSGLQTYHDKQALLSAQRTNIYVGNNTPPANAVDNLAQMLVNGTMAPSQLSKRNSGQMSYASIIDAANKLSLQQTGKPFNAEKADQAFSFGKNSSVQQTIAGLGFAKTTLYTLKNLSSKLDRGNITYGNKAGQWLAYSGSDQATVDFVTKANIAIDDVGAALGGGVSTDAKLGIAKSVIDPTLSDSAFQGQVTQLISSVQARANQYAEQMGQTASIGGTIYPVGQTISYGSTSFTVNEDSTLTGADGTLYNVDDNGDITPIQ